MNIKKKIKKALKSGDDKVIKVSLPTVVYSLLILFVILFGVASVLAYGTNTLIGARIAGKISKVVPFPAAIVKWNHVVYLNELDGNLNSVKKLYETKKFSSEGLRVDFTTEAGEKRLEIKKREILNKMVEDEIVETLSKERGIEITQAQVDEAVSEQLNEYGTTNDVKKDLLESYGWSIDDFKKQVVLPNMYAQVLAEKVLSEQGSDAIAKQKIEKAKAEIKGGAKFEDVVLKYSEGTSKNDKGELGWVKKDQMLEELSAIVFSDKNLEKGSIIESPIGFHIVEIEEKKKEGEEDVVKLKQIFVSKNTFADWLESQKKQMNVWVPMKEFKWEKNLGSVRFRDEEMNKFEEDQRSKVQGDASLMF